MFISQLQYHMSYIKNLLINDCLLLESMQITELIY